MSDKFLQALDDNFFLPIYDKFEKAVREFNLIENGDKIAVCISGGKDSMLLAKCVELYKIKSGKNFHAIFLVMDPGYLPENRQKITDNANILKIDIEIFNSQIFDIANNAGGSPCYLCARMRRGHLYSAAKARGCNKIALGHHFDDVIETALMGIVYNGQVSAMRPKLKSKNFEGMSLIRPLFFVREQDIISWRDSFNLNFLLCACSFTKDRQTDSKRLEMKNLISGFEKKYKNAALNIYKATMFIDLKNINGGKINGKKVR